jgi:two-component sensor histidine kinase
VRDTIFPLHGVVPRVGGLARDITDRKDSERQRDLLIGELNHRVKNVLAIVQSLVTQTRRSVSNPAEFEKNVTARISALSLAHDLLTQNNWEGVGLSDLVAETLKPFSDENGTDRISISGPKVNVSSHVAVTLALALHELATNATKYGSLSVSSGRVSLTWSKEQDYVTLMWRETGGPQVSEPKRSGFGAVLINALEFGPNAKAKLTYAPSGVECRIMLPKSEHVTIESRST